MRAIFKVQWEDGVPQLPIDIEVDGISAMESVSGSGLIKAQIRADEAIIETLKDSLEFVECIKEKNDGVV